MAAEVLGAADAAEAQRLLDDVMSDLRRTGPRIPGATYRLQLNHRFTFDDARALVPYLAQLGITDVYASPFFTARPGSMHGYDVVDHGTIDRALGGREAFDAFVDELERHGLGLVVDFVPNHMGVGVRENVWWMDVLENGPSSLYAPYFDIAWSPLKHELANKVLLPILGDAYGRVLERGELKVAYEHGGFFLRYFETVLPLNPRSYRQILEPLQQPLVELLGPEDDVVLELQSIVTGLEHLPPRTETSRARVVERRREKEILKRRLATLVAESPVVADALLARLSKLNGTPGEPATFDGLHALLEDQAYRLAFWRVAGEEINYRRFFDVNDLAALRIEHPPVFEATHRLLFELLAEGRVTGVRIDHPDGLRDPGGYFTGLQRGFVLEACRRRYVGEAVTKERARAFDRLRPQLEALLLDRQRDPTTPDARPLYVLAEKILSRGEPLPRTWPVYGTSGYDFANAVGGLFVDASNESALNELYERMSGLRCDFATLVHDCKMLVLKTTLASELAVLARQLDRLSERDRHTRDFTLGALRSAIREVLACFPVYRTYLNNTATQPTDAERHAIVQAVREAIRRHPATDPSIYRFVQAVLTLDIPPTVAPEDRVLWREFVLRFQQLSGPVMAKGLEDTAFYRYNRLVSLNEVGGEPERFGLGVEAFHRENVQRLTDWPAAMLTTSTHDTKRSEDVRVRIAVLSEAAGPWREVVEALATETAALKSEVDGQPSPDGNEQYLLYQTLVGAWPLEPLDARSRAEFVERIVAYMRKATKEAKVHTSWVNASPEHDEAVEKFVRAVLAEGGPADRYVAPFVAQVAPHGLWNSIAQVALKCTCPGVPDTYQGNETWDFSLVDPDNRRPVDFERRARVLEEIEALGNRGGEYVSELVDRIEDGRLKLLVTKAALGLRKRHPDAFGAEGTYVPLSARGRRAKHVVAFLRQGPASTIAVVAPRFTWTLTEGSPRPPVGALWEETSIALEPGLWRDALTGEAFEVGSDREVPLQRVLAVAPVALLVRAQPAGDIG